MTAQPFILRRTDPDRDMIFANACAFATRMMASQDVRIEISREVKRRTKKQNSSLWGVAEKTIADFCGYRGAKDMEELHRTLCGEYFGWRDDGVLGKVPVRRTTTNERGERDEISVSDALDMYAFIQQFAAERLGCFVPDPDPFWSEKARAA